MSEKRDIPENIQIYILEKEKELREQQIEFREQSRREIQSARTRTLGGIALISGVVGIAGAFGINSSIQTASQKAVEQKVGNEFLDRAKTTFYEIDSIKTESESSFERIRKIEQQINERDWLDVRFESNWTNYGGGYNPAGYTKDELGRVHLRGLVKGGTTRSVICELPEGYQPKFRELFIVKTSEGSSRVDVDVKGKMILMDEFNGWISLDGISFSSETTSIEFQNEEDQEGHKEAP